MIPNGELRLPAPKVRDGRVSPPAPIPVTRTLVADTDATSDDDDMSTNSEDVSLDSSPENSRVSSAVGRSYGRNSSYYTYSEVSSSRETLVGGREQTGPRFDGDTEEDESTDSASSSQFSPPPAAGRIHGGVPQVEQTHFPKTDGRATVEKVWTLTFCVNISDIRNSLVRWMILGVRRARMTNKMTDMERYAIAFCSHLFWLWFEDFDFVII